MVKFIDVYMVPVPRKNLAAYKRLARTWGRIMQDHGIMTYREFVAAKGGEWKGVPSVAGLVKPKAGEVTIVAVAAVKNRAAREQGKPAGEQAQRRAKVVGAE